jgi:hypothetical protein
MGCGTSSSANVAVEPEPHVSAIPSIDCGMMSPIVFEPATDAFDNNNNNNNNNSGAFTVNPLSPLHLSVRRDSQLEPSPTSNAASPSSRKTARSLSLVSNGAGLERVESLTTLLPVSHGQQPSYSGAFEPSPNNSTSTDAGMRPGDDEKRPRTTAHPTVITPELTSPPVATSATHTLPSSLPPLGKRLSKSRSNSELRPADAPATPIALPVRPRRRSSTRSASDGAFLEPAPSFTPEFIANIERQLDAAIARY